MFVCVVSLSQPSSRVVINVFGICYICIISRICSMLNVFGVCYMLNVLCCLLSQPSSRVVINVFGICYMLNVCVCCLVISAQ